MLKFNCSYFCGNYLCCLIDLFVPLIMTPVNMDLLLDQPRCLRLVPFFPYWERESRIQTDNVQFQS